MKLLTALHQLFCQHKEMLTKVDGPRLYCECLRCGHQTRGVEISKDFRVRRAMSQDRKKIII